MRRHHIGFIALGVFALILVAAILPSISRAPKFNFINVPVQHSDVYGNAVRYTYSVPGDLEGFMQKAEPELVSQGYREVTSARPTRFFVRASDDAVVWVYSGRWVPSLPNVPATHYGIIDTREPGWVCVSTEKPDLWHKITQWYELRTRKQGP